MSREVPHSRTAPEVEERIVELLRSGLSFADAAAEVGVATGTAHNVAKRAGILDELRQLRSSARTKGNAAPLPPEIRAELDAVLAKTIVAIDKYLAAPVDQRDAGEGATLARIFKELHNMQRLDDGACTARRETHSTVTHRSEQVIVEVDGGGRDPLGPLRRFGGLD